MDYDQLELQRETIFKDAVLRGAQQRAANIVERAEMESQREIQKAMLTCEEADHDTVAQKHAMNTARQVGALGHNARRELLQWRGQLVERMFREIEGDLVAFVQSEGYPEWLAGRIQKYAGALGKAAKPVVYLRGADLAHADVLRTAVPGAEFLESGDIRLGGCRVGDGKRLYDETLDAALENEKQRFYAESELCI